MINYFKLIIYAQKYRRAWFTWIKSINSKNENKLFNKLEDVEHELLEIIIKNKKKG